MNLYGERVTLKETIIGLQINFTNLEPDQASSDGTEPDIYRYVEQHRHGESVPSRFFWAMKSEYFSGKIALEWATRTGAHFIWGVRQRMDVMYPTNIWEQLFHIEPLIHFINPTTQIPTLLPSIQLSQTPVSLTDELPPNTYWLVGDHLYRLLWKADKLYSVNYNEFGGLNDQALMGYGPYMIRYSMRWNTTILREWMSRSPFSHTGECNLYTPSNPTDIRNTWVYHPETFALQFLLTARPPIPYIRDRICYHIVRSISFENWGKVYCYPNDACRGCDGTPSHPVANNIRYQIQNEQLTNYLNPMNQTLLIDIKDQERRIQLWYSHMWTQIENPTTRTDAWMTWQILRNSVHEPQQQILATYLKSLGFPALAIHTSNYYYYYRYRVSPIIETQCVARQAEDWTSPHENFHSHYWPFIQVSSHVDSLASFIEHIVCKGLKI